MDGLEAIRVLKASAETRDIAILAVASSAMKVDEERIIATCADDYIPKPIDTCQSPEIIPDLIEEGRWRRRQEIK